jgi:hypothetical protein
MTATPPLLSVILLTQGSFEVLRRVVGHLRAQGVRDRIELVLVAPSEAGLQPDPAALEGFHGVSVVATGPIEAAGVAVAAGARVASAEIVVYVEEHSFPAPGWAEALIRAHEGPWAAVGPAMTNANPDSMASWTSFLLDFGAWVLPAEAGPADTLPAHQTSYKREVLLSYGEALGDLLETETTLQHDLKARGHGLFFEPAARTDHLNISRLSDIAILQFHNYRAFAANRARDGRWPWSRRLAYIVGSPLIPLVRGARILGQVRDRGLGRTMLPGILPPLAMGLVAGAAGEVLGYSLGAGDSPRARLTFELDRLSHVSDRDRRRLLSGGRR